MIDTVTDWFRKVNGWCRESCSSCYGTGMESDYDYWSGDFMGPKECGSCGGNGQYWISPRGRHVLYPGGPFC